MNLETGEYNDGGIFTGGQSEAQEVQQQEEEERRIGFTGLSDACCCPWGVFVIRIVAL